MQTHRYWEPNRRLPACHSGITCMHSLPFLSGLHFYHVDTIAVHAPLPWNCLFANLSLLFSTTIYLLCVCCLRTPPPGRSLELVSDSTTAFILNYLPHYCFSPLHSISPPHLCCKYHTIFSFWAAFLCLFVPDSRACLHFYLAHHDNVTTIQTSAFRSHRFREQFCILRSVGHRLLPRLSRRHSLYAPPSLTPHLEHIPVSFVHSITHSAISTALHGFSCRFLELCSRWVLCRVFTIRTFVFTYCFPRTCILHFCVCVLSLSGLPAPLTFHFLQYPPSHVLRSCVLHTNFCLVSCHHLCDSFTATAF